MIQTRNGKFTGLTLEPAIQIRQVGRFVYDVFSGNGFSTWTRVRRYHWGVKHLAGEPINKVQSKQLHDLTERIPYGWIEPIAV